MKSRQSLPEQWLITDERIGRLDVMLRHLPRGGGVVLRGQFASGERRQLLRAARAQALVIVDEGRGGAARVHDPREIARARLNGAALLLLSPMFASRSHPEWPPLPRMRAAALARLAGRPLLALGGMDADRYRRVRALGFDGWAGIDAWLSQRIRI